MELHFREQLKAQPFWVLLFLVLGFLPLLKSALAFLKWVYVNFLRPAKNLKKYGSWALVTGPTDGIGKYLAFELAGKELNLILVGRNPNKLKEVSDAIQAKYWKTQIKIVVVDFSGDLSKGIQRIQESIEGLDVGVLINNAGVSYPFAKFFHEVDEEMCKNLIKVNVEGPTKVTQAVLPGMLQRKKGAIVNIGSGSVNAVPSYPLYTVYAATKAYIHLFSKSLCVEYKKSGIDVQCQVPLLVATKMTKLKSSFFTPTPEAYSRASIRWIGYEPLCVPYWLHSIQFNILRALPDALMNMLALRYFLGTRKRGQMKESLQKKKKSP